MLGVLVLRSGSGRSVLLDRGLEGCFRFYLSNVIPLLFRMLSLL